MTGAASDALSQLLGSDDGFVAFSCSSRKQEYPLLLCLRWPF